MYERLSVWTRRQVPGLSTVGADAISTVVDIASASAVVSEGLLNNLRLSRLEPLRLETNGPGEEGQRG